jgi:hypothetical protein
MTIVRLNGHGTGKKEEKIEEILAFLYLIQEKALSYNKNANLMQNGSYFNEKVKFKTSA